MKIQFADAASVCCRRQTAFNYVLNGTNSSLAALFIIYFFLLSTLIGFWDILYNKRNCRIKKLQLIGLLYYSIKTGTYYPLIRIINMFSINKVLFVLVFFSLPIIMSLLSLFNNIEIEEISVFQMVQNIIIIITLGMIRDLYFLLINI